jgi:hypothetical protein
MDRKFEGVYFSFELWLDKSIPALEKMVFVEIRSLDNNKGCFAGNDHFAEMFGVTERQVQRYIASLKNRGYITQESFDGRKRVLRVSEGMRGDKNVISDTTSMSLQTRSNCRDISSIIEKEHKEKNKDNSKYIPLSEYLKERLIKESPDAIIKESQVKDWCNDFRLMVEQDKRTDQQIREKIDAVFSDSFWCRTIQSASKLRLRWNEGKLSHLNVVQIGHDDPPEEFVDSPNAYDMPQR